MMIVLVKSSRPLRSNERQKFYIINDPKQHEPSPAVSGFFLRRSLTPSKSPVMRKDCWRDAKLPLIEMQCDDILRSRHQQHPLLQINRGLENGKFPPDEASCQKYLPQVGTHFLL